MTTKKEIREIEKHIPNGMWSEEKCNLTWGEVYRSVMGLGDTNRHYVLKNLISFKKEKEND